MPKINVTLELTDIQDQELYKYLKSRGWTIKEYLETLVIEHQSALAEAEQKYDVPCGGDEISLSLQNTINCMCEKLEKHEEMIFKLASQCQQLKAEMDKRNNQIILTP